MVRVLTHLIEEPKAPRISHHNLTTQSLEGRPGTRIQNSNPKMYTLSSGDYKVTGIKTTKKQKAFCSVLRCFIGVQKPKYKGENIWIVAP